MTTGTASLETKLQELRQSTHAYMTELEEALNSKRRQPADCISFFTYAYNVAHHLESDNMCLASYHIRNIGEGILTKPEIVLTLSDPELFSLHGKYIHSDSPIPAKLKDGWIRIYDPDAPHVFHLRPAENKGILPGETLTFSSFQVIWKPSGEYAGSITGRTFSEQNHKGIAALNSINMSGTLPIEGGES